ncbi:MAG: NADH-quinone oxidoreductase subunit A [Bdellovibrionales bacterium GWB1_55_8]|nr:MAG: NADH-quinone oxidoreductase subunit A [Bdellovibrionales bacterium GWB1_55_8]
MAYIPVLILLTLGVLIGVGALGVSALLGPKFPTRKKDLPYECGQTPITDARHRIPARFYLVAILFLLFDVEAIFFFPWAVVYKKYLTINAFILIEMAIFLAILLVGYFYVLRKGALEWE